MVRRFLSACLLIAASFSMVGCKGSEAPPPIAAPSSPSERAVLLLANGARAVGRVRLDSLRGSLSTPRLDELGETIFSKRFRLPLDVAREVDEIYFASYAYDKPDAVALLRGHFRANELREALAREAALADGTAKEAPSVNGARFYRVGQGDVHVLSEDLVAIGSRAGLVRFLERQTTAAPLEVFPVTLASDAVGAFKASGPKGPDELTPMLRQQALAVGLREASGLIAKEGSDFVFVLSAAFANDDLAKEAHARVLPFAKLVPTWTRQALPAAEVFSVGPTVTVRERVDASKLEALAAMSSSFVPR